MLLTWLRVLLLGLWPVSAVSAHEVLLVGAQAQPSISTFVEALQNRRTQDRVRFQTVSQMPRPADLPADVRLVLLDGAALDWRLSEQRGPAALALRVSRVQIHQRLGLRQPPYLSLLWSDPPVTRQLQLLRHILPTAKRVGVLYGPHSAFLLDEVHSAAARLGLTIVTLPWDDTRNSRPPQALLDHSDVLLGLDDNGLFNSQTGKGLLLAVYGRHRALIGPSIGFVRAGALASTYSDQGHWLDELDVLLTQPPETWPRSQYPARFGVSVNTQVTRALALLPIDEAAAAAALNAQASGL